MVIYIFRLEDKQIYKKLVIKFYQQSAITNYKISPKKTISISGFEFVLLKNTESITSKILKCQGLVLRKMYFVILKLNNLSIK